MYSNKQVYKIFLFIALASVIVYSCEENAKAGKIIYSKKVPTFYLFQHVNQVLKDSVTEDIIYELSAEPVKKQDVLHVARVLKKRNWDFYFNSDSSNIFIPNYNNENEEILKQLYLIYNEK